MTFLTGLIIKEDVVVTNSFRIALLISLAVHVAVLAPYAAMRSDMEPERTNIDMDLNYVSIQRPELAVQEEIFKECIREHKSEKHKDDRAETFDEEYYKNDVAETEIDEKVVTEADEKEAKSLDVDQTAFLEYYNLIREKIRFEIRKQGGVGTGGEVKIIFTISPSGKLMRIDSVTSDSNNLSKRIARGIKSVEPFPAFPGEIGMKPITFSLTIKII